MEITTMKHLKETDIILIPEHDKDKVLIGMLATSVEGTQIVYGIDKKILRASISIDTFLKILSKHCLSTHNKYCLSTINK